VIPVNTQTVRESRLTADMERVGEPWLEDQTLKPKPNLEPGPHFAQFCKAEGGKEAAEERLEGSGGRLVRCKEGSSSVTHECQTRHQV
jgi:hypothetical protein